MVDAHNGPAREQLRRDHRQLTFEFGQFALRDDAAPDPSPHGRDRFERFGFEQNLSAIDDRHPAAQLRHIVDDVRRENDDGVFADVAEQVQETDAFAGIEAGGRLVDDDQRRVSEERDRDAEPLAHAPGVGAELLLPDVVQVRLVEEGVDDLPARPRPVMPFSTAK